MENKTLRAISMAKEKLGRHPHPDWLVKVLGISQGEAVKALVADGWKPPKVDTAPKPQPQSTKADFHLLPSHIVRGGLGALAILATMREFGYVFDYFGGFGGVIMALLISGGSTILPQATALLWPKRGTTYKALALISLVVSLLVLCSSIYITTSGLWKAQTVEQVETRDITAEVEAQGLAEITRGLERQIQDKRGDLKASRARSTSLDGWQLALEVKRGDLLAKELTALETRLESRMVELSTAQAKAGQRARGSLVEKTGETVELWFSIGISAVIALIGPLAFSASLWGGLEKTTSGKSK
jgi:uncharacterized membrane protein